MKKITSLALVLTMLLACLAFASCGAQLTEEDVIGTYTLETLSGEMDFGGMKIELSKEMFTEYTIILKSDGKCSSYTTMTMMGQTVGPAETHGTWTIEDGKIVMTSDDDEVMTCTYRGGKLTIDETKDVEGIKTTLKVTLKKS